MKRRELLRHLQQHDCRLLREGSRHSVWLNPVTNRKEAIPRHAEVPNFLARSICRNLGLPDPE